MRVNEKEINNQHSRAVSIVVGNRAVSIAKAVVGLEGIANEIHKAGRYHE